MDQAEWTKSEAFANKLRFSLEKREDEKQAALSALRAQWDMEKGTIPLKPKPRVPVVNNNVDVDNVGTPPSSPYVQRATVNDKPQVRSGNGI